MARAETQELQAREKKEVSNRAEQTKAGLVFTPPVDIYETPTEITVLADMPGVSTEDLTVRLHENLLTLSGDVKSPEGPNERIVLREYQTGRYFRQFALSDEIDQDKVEANLTDGVLRLKLPKVAAAQPRTITVKTTG
jgi:HSP20 family molecular chaperone IbpA